MGVIPLVVHDLDAKNLHLGSDAKNPSDGTPGTLEAHLSIPERIDRVELAASVSRATLSPLGIAGSATLDVHGARRVALGALLKMVGIEPEARVADLHLGLDVDARRDAGGWLADLEAKNLEIIDGSTRVAGIESAKVKGARLRPDSIHADLISLVKPTLVAVREPEGMMRIGSVRFAAAEVETVGATDAAPAALEIAAAAPEAESKPTQKPAGDPTQTRRPSGEPPCRSTRFGSKGAVTWIDECIQPRLETIVGADLAIDGFALGSARAPFKIDAKVGIAESFDELRVLGEASLAPGDRCAARSTFAGSAAEGSAAISPGTKLGMADGHFSVGFLAEAGSGAKGRDRRSSSSATPS